MRRRALIGALSVTLLVLPLISAWCPRCLSGGGCSMGTMAEAALTAAGDGPCHLTEEAPEVAVAAVDGDCCQIAMGPAPSSPGAPIAAVHLGFHLEPAPGGDAPVAPQLSDELGEDHGPPSHGASTPLFTLHSSLLL